MGNYTGIFTRQGLKTVLKSRCGLFLVMFVVSISFSANLFSADKNSLTPINAVNNQLEQNLRAPFRRVEHIIDLVNSKALNASFDDGGVTQQGRLDFKWAFTAEGVSFLKPVISESGNVHVATTDIDVTVALDELEENGEEAVTIGEINSNLYALKPNPISPRGKEEWMFNTDGIILFPPVISDDEKVFVESLFVDIDAGSNTVNGFSVNLSAVQEGENVWPNSVEFANSIPLSSPVVAQNTVLMTTLKTPDFSDFNISDLSGEISALDSETGNTKWLFNPADTGMKTEDGEGEEGNSLPKFLVAPPAVDGNTVFVNTISSTSIDDIKEFLENSIEGVEELLNTIVFDTVPDLLIAILAGRDTDAIIDPVEDEIEVIITDIINDLVEELSNLGTLFALNLDDGSVKWSSKFQGVSISSPVITNSDVVTVGSTNLKLDETNVDVNIGINLTDEEVLVFDISLKIDIAGITFGIKQVVEVDLAALVDDPTNVAEAVNRLPLETDAADIDELIIAVDGRVSGFNIVDGSKAWETTVDSPVLLKPVVSNEMDQVIAGGTNFSVERTDSGVDIGGFASKVYAVNGLNGNLDWESDAFAGVIGLPPLDLILGDPILVSTDGSVFFSFFDIENDDPSSGVLKVWAVSQGGSMKWSSPFVPEDLGTSAPVIDPETGKVFLSLSQIEIPDPEGELPDDGETPNLRDLKPDLKGLVIGLDPLSGAVDKSVEVEGFVISSPAIDPRGGTAFISTMDFEVNRDPISLDLLSFVQAVKVR